MTEAAIAEVSVTDNYEGGDSNEERSLASDAWRSMRRNPLFWVAATPIALFTLMAVFPGLFTWLAQLTPVRSSEMGLIFAVGLTGGVAGPALIGVLVDTAGRAWIGPGAAVFVLSALLVAGAPGRVVALSRP